MRSLWICLMALAFTACGQSDRQKEINRLEKTRLQLTAERDKARQELADTRKTLKVLRAASQDLEIEQRLARMKTEQNKLALQRALEANKMAQEGGGELTDQDVENDDHRLMVEQQNKLKNEKFAKRLFEEAYVLKDSNPKRAIRNMKMIMVMLPDDHVYHAKAQKLLASMPVPKASPVPKVVGELDLSGSASDLRKRGISAHKERNFVRAAAYYQKALDKNPKDYDLHRLLGTTCAQQGQRKDAYQHYQKYAELCPKCMYAPAIRKILADYRELSK